MSGQHTLNLAATPSVSSASSSIVASTPNGSVVFDPRTVQMDSNQFRIGGFRGGLPEPMLSTASGSESASPTDGVEGDVDSIPNAEGTQNEKQAEEPTKTEKTEEEKAKEEREKRFQELLRSGKLGTLTFDDTPPGKRFTMPVERPKYL
ncbi:hypothetical protein BG011_010017 [Mortierella polycephala]|uniref:Uncharacterized protein n=1 Tax=Mortierella polycephala TaxID=41804 RepID=A0A9P6PMG2_9FUNG|nr:hypothetical protein BG011_010017 [Mortierella polycephala]